MSDGDCEACKGYGALTEGIHVGGYAVERALRRLEWLLKENRWQQLGVPFKDVNAFLDSIKLDNLRIVADQRKRIAERIKQLQPDASNRVIAKMLGVSHQTINNDSRGKNLPGSQTKPAKIKPSDAANGKNLPGGGGALSGSQVASLVRKEEEKQARGDDTKERRAERERRLAIKQSALPNRKFGV